MEERPRGRPETFDRDEVVRRAMQAFWREGFDGTSLSRLERATGTDRSTLYNSFGGKRGLHRSAAEAYVDQTVDQLFEPLLHGHADDLTDIVAFLRTLGAVLGSDEYPAGCFIVNDLGAPSSDDAATDRYLDALRAGLRSALRRGGLDAGLVEERSGVLATSVVGVNAVARRDTELAVSMLEQTISLVERWSAELQP